jgi:cytosine/adenosine deaminase-related metal-dependent hydrolase
LTKAEEQVNKDFLMKSHLAKNADILVTMDKDRREIKNASLYAEDGVIKKIGPASELPQTADTVIDMSGQIVMPGFVNCHHHLNQTLTRNIPACQNNNLFPLPHLGQYDAGGLTHERDRRACRARPQRMHDGFRPFVHF